MMHLTEQFKHLKIELEAIKYATNNFADDNCIGRGGFGKVYKGVVLHSKGQTIVALKRLDSRFGQGNPEFWKEIIMLSLYKHENLVSLLGFCVEGNEKILVYEYASRKSLDLYLDSNDLTWIDRLKICIGAARGLAYLHNHGETQQRALHRDIKSSNILLDEKWNAKISDKGLAKFGPANPRYMFLVSNTIGTIGYCDPLYVETGLLTKESDVYSLGIVLFEVLCGRVCISNKSDIHQSLASLVRQHYKQKKINQIIFGTIKDEITPSSLDAFTTIAYRCLKRDLKERPLMSDIVKVLESALEYQCDNSQKMETMEIISEILIPQDGDFVDAEDDNSREEYEEKDIIRVQNHEEEDTKNYEEEDTNKLLPSIEDLQILGEAFLGFEIQVVGRSINGTTCCNFEWVRHYLDGSVKYVEGAKQPKYVLTADDADTYLAVEVQPLDDQKRKGELVKFFANDNKKIGCHPDMIREIEKILNTGHTSFRVFVRETSLDTWELGTLKIKRSGYTIKINEPNGSVVVDEKYTKFTIFILPSQAQVEFLILSPRVVEQYLRTDPSRISLRDTIVLTMRLFHKLAADRKLGEKKRRCLLF